MHSALNGVYSVMPKFYCYACPLCQLFIFQFGGSCISRAPICHNLVFLQHFFSSKEAIQHVQILLYARMDNTRCRWRRLFCFTKGSLAVHLSADWRQRCLFEPLDCKEMNSLAVLSQSFSRAWLFTGDSLHGTQLNPVLPVIAILQRVALCKSRYGVLLHWRKYPWYPLVRAKRLNSRLLN